MSSSVCLMVAAVAATAAQRPADLREAARLDQAGRCGEAESIYQRALSQGVPKPALLNNLGNHYLACGQPNKARDYFERLVGVQPLHLNGNIQLARLAMNSGEFSRAEELLQKIAAAHPGEFGILYWLGRASARAGHMSRARDTLEAALRLRPDDIDAMVECGLANAASGDFPRAVFLLARAQARAPDKSPLALALARASEDAGYYGDALVAYDRYLRLRPDDDSARRDRARVLAFTINGREQGVRELGQYVAGNPADALGHFYLAQVCWSSDPEGALASLAEAVRLNPRLASAHISRAWLLHRMGRDVEALPHLEAALRQSATDVRPLDLMGLVLLSLNRVGEAEAALRRAAELAPKDASVALHLGRALMDAGKEDEGQRWLDLFQKLRPSRTRDARRETGMIELATLDPAARRSREIERFRSMAAARPDDPLLQMHLAGLLLSDGRTADALLEYRRLLSMNAGDAVWAEAGRTLSDAAQYEAARPFLERAGSRLEVAEVLLATREPADALKVLDDIPPAGHSPEYKVLRARVLDAAGRFDESDQLLADGLPGATPSPAVARQASLLWAKHGRYRESVELLARCIRAAPADPELRLAEAIVLALSGESAAAMERMRQIQSIWPEWDQAWMAHGLLLKEMRRPREAAARLRAAVALGTGEETIQCESLRAWVFGSCGR